jgi:hypothetical protein
MKSTMSWKLWVLAPAVAIALSLTACSDPGPEATRAVEPLDTGATETIEQGQSHLGQAPPANLQLSHNGLQWLLASPCVNGGCSSIRFHSGWRYATNAEWAARPDLRWFSNNRRCASAYFDNRYNHCDYGDITRGHVTSHPNQLERGKSTCCSETFLVKSNGPGPPTIESPGGQTSGEGRAVNLQIQASDPNGDQLQFSATGLPPNLSINAGSGLITGTVPNGARANSPYSVRVTVTAGDDTVSTTFSWTVVDRVSRILIVGQEGSQSHIDGVRDYVRAGCGCEVDSATTQPLNSLTLNDLQQYDTLLVWTNYRPNQTRGGDLLADFVDGGGNVVTATFNETAWGVKGRWTSQSYSPVSQTDSRAGIYETHSMGTVNEPSHPIMAGVSSVRARTYRSADGNRVRGGARTVASWDDNNVLVAVAEDKPGRIAFVGFYPTAWPSHMSGDWQRLVVNALNWASNGGGQENSAPTVTAPGNQESVERDAVSLQVTVGDEDGDDLEVTAQGLPGGLRIDNTGKISGTVDDGAAQNSPYAVRITVSDGEEEESAAFTWTVYNDVDPTVAFTGPPEAWHGSAVTVSGTITEPGCNKNPSIQATGVTGYNLVGEAGAWTFIKSGVGAGRYVPARVVVTSTCTGRSVTADRNFGVDVGDPRLLMAQSLLSQNGVDPDDPRTWPKINVFDDLPLTIRAQDSVSGVRTINALVERADNNAQTSIYTYNVSLSGTPPGGSSSVTESACDNDSFCDDSGALRVRTLPGVNQILRVSATDAAGRSVTNNYYFVKFGLREAIVAWGDAVPNSSDVVAAQGKLDAARAALDQAVVSYDAGQYGSISLLTQLAQSSLLGAKTLDDSLDVSGSDDAGDSLGQVFTGFLGVRLARHRSEVGERTAFETADASLATARQSDDVGTVLNALANAWFWMEDGRYPMEGVNPAGAQVLLGRIIAELDTYVTYEPALVGRGQLAEARTNLAAVKVLIDRAVADGDTSLTDLEHVQLLLGLTNTAENLKSSQDGGAWVRNWQWGLAQIVYIYAARGLHNARDFVGPFNPVYFEGEAELARANSYRLARKADDFMNLLIDSRCLTIAIYNKAYDPDVDAPQACCERMLRYANLDPSFPVPRRCNNTAPVVMDPGQLENSLNDEVSVAIEAEDANGDELEYSATGLPTGLSIDSSTGVISGTITDGSESPYSTAVTVTDGLESVTVSFQWTVLGGGGADYSGDFTRRVGYNRASQQCTAWHNWVGELGQVQSFSRITIRGSRNTEGYSCSGASANRLCSLLSRPKNEVSRQSFECDGRTWWIGSCGTQLEVNVGAGGICRCSSGEGVATVRPCIREDITSNANWGGIDGATCGAESQTMEVVCE